MRRLTRLSARSVEQPVNLDTETTVFNYPELNAGEMGDWKLTNDQILALREYLLRGGFLMLDDFWGTEEWKPVQREHGARVPRSEAVEIADDRSDLPHRLRSRPAVSDSGQWALRGGTTYRNDGATAHWLGIYDDHGRVMVAMTFNRMSAIRGSGRTTRATPKIFSPGKSELA